MNAILVVCRTCRSRIFVPLEKMRRLQHSLNNLDKFAPQLAPGDRIIISSCDKCGEGDLPFSYSHLPAPQS